MIELLASAARTATGQQEITGFDLDLAESLVALLDVTAAAAAAGDTLNLRLQQGFEDGAGTIIVWDDFVSFDQVLGNASTPVRRIASWRRDGGAPESEMRTPTSSLAAGSVLQGPVTKRWRWNWTIGGATPNFTFRVFGHLVMRRR